MLPNENFLQLNSPWLSAGPASKYIFLGIDTSCVHDIETQRFRDVERIAAECISFGASVEGNDDVAETNEGTESGLVEDGLEGQSSNGEQGHENVED